LTTSLSAGVAQIAITPEIGTKLAGSLWPRVSQGVQDPLYVKALVVESEGKQLAMVSLDIVSLERAQGDRAVALASEAARIPPDRIVWAATHTHTGPYTRKRLSEHINAEWLAKLPGRIAQAVADAQANLRPARLSRLRAFHFAMCHNRRVAFKDGRHVNTWLLGNDCGVQSVGSAGPIDPEIGMLAFDDADGKLMALVFTYALHTNANFGPCFSADYPATVAKRICERFGDQAATIYFPGCCGNINPCVPAGADRRDIVVGNLLADAMIPAIEKRQPLPGPFPLNAAKREITVPYRDLWMDMEERLAKTMYPAKSCDHFREAQKALQAEGKTQTDTILQAWHIGDTGFLSLPGEVFVEWGIKIKQASPFPWTFPVELGADALGYLVTRDAYEAGGYESLLSYGTMIDVAGVELMVDRGLSDLRRLHQMAANS
jgi:hypothetical protein